VLISTTSYNKIGYVQTEIRLVLDAADEQPAGSVFILPLRLGGAEVLERLPALHYVDMDGNDWHQLIERSLKLVRTH
jgi:hypothetical protein